MRDIRLRLIVVIVGNEVVHRVLGEKFSILLRELGGERFIVCEHEGRLVVLRDDVRDRKRLTRTGHAEERLVAHTLLQPFLNGLNRLWLVARRLEW